MDYKLGDTKLAPEIGKPGKGRFTWVECPICKERRWAPRRTIEPTYRLCRECTLINAKRNFIIGKSIKNIQ